MVCKCNGVHSTLLFSYFVVEHLRYGELSLNSKSKLDLALQSTKVLINILLINLRISLIVSDRNGYISIYNVCS